MKRSRREKFNYFLDSGGPWKNPLPELLRVAAELQFGTVILFAVIIGVKEGPTFGVAGIVMAVTAWLITHFRGATSPASWWISVVVFTTFGALLSLVVLAS